MPFNYMNSMMSQYWGNPGNFQIIAMILLFWTLPWKGYALWIAARKGDRYWFVALLLLNTLAILEILYIFVFSKEKPKAIK